MMLPQVPWKRTMWISRKIWLFWPVRVRVRVLTTTTTTTTVAEATQQTAGSGATDTTIYDMLFFYLLFAASMLARWVCLRFSQYDNIVLGHRRCLPTATLCTILMYVQQYHHVIVFAVTSCFSHSHSHTYTHDKIFK